MFKNQDQKLRYRINYQIKFSPVMVVKEGQNLGVMSVDAARNLAKNEDLDLVEIAPNARPPVCRIMDFGKFKYELSIREKNKQHKDHVLKELRMTPVIAEHDLDVKIKSAKRFLEDGHKVQVKVMYKKREVPHKQLGYNILDKFVNELNGLFECKAPATFSVNTKGATLCSMLEPKKDLKK
jgi:translation initiation factor IF-3